LFTIDCLRYDYFNSTLNPYLRRFKKNEYSWEKMVAAGPWTGPSMSSLFTSEFPFKKNERFVPIPENLKIFPEILRDNGILTCGIHSNPWLSKEFNFNRGFQFFYDLKQNAINHLILWAYRETSKYLKRVFRLSVFNQILSIFERLLGQTGSSIERNKILDGTLQPYANSQLLLKKALVFTKKYRNQSFFIWIHLMDIHPPYSRKIPEFKSSKKELVNLNNKILALSLRFRTPQTFLSYREKNLILQLYEGNLKKIGQQLVEFQDSVKKICDQDVDYLITADHGDLLFEDGLFSHPVTYEDNLIHIPFKILTSTNLETQLNNDLISNIDIAPTILDLFHINNKENFGGISLIDKTNEIHDIIASGSYFSDSFQPRVLPKFPRKICLLLGNYKYIFNEQDNSEIILDTFNVPEKELDINEVNSQILSKFRNYVEDFKKKGHYQQEEQKIRKSLKKWGIPKSHTS